MQISGSSRGSRRHNKTSAQQVAEMKSDKWHNADLMESNLVNEIQKPRILIIHQSKRDFCWFFFADDLQARAMINRQVPCCCVWLFKRHTKLKQFPHCVGWQTEVCFLFRLSAFYFFFFRWARKHMFWKLNECLLFHLCAGIVQMWWQVQVVVTQTRLKFNDDVSLDSPRSTILPKRFLPRRKLRVEQFHRRFLNWCWHSEMAMLAPFAIAASTPGFSRASRRCFRRSVAWIAGSIYTCTGVTGEMLFGSPAFAMPLQ